MLYRLEVSNLFSIRDPQVLDLSIAPNVPDPDGRYEPIFRGATIRAPKVIAVYGANASGKTNLLKALGLIALFARDSAKMAPHSFPLLRFNDAASMSRPVEFAIEFGGAMNLTPEVLSRAKRGDNVEWGVYRYELSIGGEGIASVNVLKESLHQKPWGRGKWQRVFERGVDGEVQGSESFVMSGFRHLEKTLQPYVSVLSSFAFFNHPAASALVDALNHVFTFAPGQFSDTDLHALFAQNPSLLHNLNQELSRIDVGLLSARIESGPQGSKTLWFTHAGLQSEMLWALESRGTQSFIRMFPWVDRAVRESGIAVVDEIDATIHPFLLPRMLRKFYDSAGAQIWFSTHSAALLDELNKEEVVLCEKDSQGRTRAYSLMDVQGIRRDDNLYRKYLSGAYGGVPTIG